MSGNNSLNRKMVKLEQFEVQKIVGQKKAGNRILYLVKWKGYPHEENTWEPKSHLINVPEKIAQWKKIKSKTQKVSKLPPTQKKLISKKKVAPIFLEKNEEKYKIMEERKYEREADEQQIKVSSRKQYSSRINDNFHQMICQSSIRKSTNDLCLVNTNEPSENMKTRSKGSYQFKALEQSSCSKRGKKSSHHMSQQQEVKVQQSIGSSIVQQSEDKEESIIEPMKKVEYQPEIDFVNKSKDDVFISEPIEEQPLLFETYQKHQSEDRFVIQQEKIDDVNPQFEPISNIEDVQNHNSPFFQESIQPTPLPPLIQRERSYFNLVEIYKMYKYHGVVYCTGVNKQGLQVDRIPYDALQALRPDIIVNFFNIKW